ncbi:MAG: hypothetical protein GY913_21830 [Proteobacteria bacterium]|nr:hypothetical protein [Actinomycetes bacterium]MCP4919551.1 hypothetical protein [Pseudomonadota bacterium]
MARVGFVVSDVNNSAITADLSTTAVVLLHADSDQDANSEAMPSSGYLSHVELHFTSAATPTTVQAHLTWELAGDEPASGQSAATTLHALQTSDEKGAAIGIDQFYRTPALATSAGQIYLWLVLDSGTATLESARLHWAEHLGR